MKAEESTQALARLTAMYPRADIPKATLAAWAAMLCRAEYEFTSFCEAVDRLATRSKFPPTLAEWIDEARQVRRERVEQIDGKENAGLLPPSASYTDEQRAKARLHMANIRAFLAGDRKASDFLVESLRIYVEERPFPATQDAMAMEAAMDKTLSGLRDKPGPLFRHLRKPGGAV